VVKSIPFPEKGQVFIWDSEIKGFGLRVSQQTKSFIAEKRLEGTGKTRRITIGTWPTFKVADARKEAEKIIGELAKGFDRKAAQREAQVKAVTLQEVFDRFATERNLKQTTAYDYRRIFQASFPDWAKLPWVNVTTTKVKQRHTDLTKAHGPGYANYALKILSALLNYARNTYRTSDDEPLIVENPVSVLGRTHGWNRLEPRDTYIKAHQFKQVWDAIAAIEAENPAGATYIKGLVFTGLRKMELASLRKSNIDLQNATLTVENTKNGSKHVIPLPPYVAEMFRVQMERSDSDFVFPGPGKEGHLAEPKKFVAKVAKLAGVDFSPHDLRRTFSVYLESLDVTAYALKRLLNHRSGDVTYKHYLPLDVERLREPMQKLCDYMLKLAGVKETAPVVPLQAVSA
jgi:integrase